MGGLTETEIEGHDLDLGNNGKQRKIWNSWRMCAEIHIMSVTLCSLLQVTQPL